MAIINQNTDCVVTYETYREGRKNSWSGVCT
ncbi:hypothetical protein [Candidatus Competibacter phosphatis]